MRKCWQAIFLFVSLLGINNIRAQEICRANPLNDASPLTQDYHHYRRLADVQEPEGKIPSYWKYRHKSLHDRGIVQQILDKTGSNCCGGTDSGECRVSYVDMLHRMVMIDGTWCPMTRGTKFAVVTGLKDDESAVVCAGRVSDETNCPPAYCVGVRGDGS